MSWKEKRLITILSIILAVLCAAVLVVLSIRYRAAQAAKDQNTVSPSDIAEAAQSEYVALSYSNGSTTLSFSLNEDGVWTWDSEPDFPLDDTHVKSILTILETLKPQQTLDMPEDLSVYGLDAPDVSLTATAPDDAVLTVTLGNATTEGPSYYATINSDPDHASGHADAHLPDVPPAGAAGIDGEHHHVHPAAGTAGGAGGSGREQYSGPEFHCAHCHPCGG